MIMFDAYKMLHSVGSLNELLLVAICKTRSGKIRLRVPLPLAINPLLLLVTVNLLLLLILLITQC